MSEQISNEALGAKVLGVILIIGLPLFLAFCAFDTVSVPGHVVDGCKSAAVRAGFGRCTAVSGQEANSGVYQVELDCSNGRALCQGRDTFRITPWSSLADYLMEK